MGQMSEAIKIDIWSDIACPWCYIGKRNLETALASFEGEVEVEYHSFELSPDTPVDFEGTGVDYLVGRKGISVGQAEQMMSHVTAAAAAVGLDYDLGSVRHTNTRKAHAALHFAKAHGRQSELKERLLRAYFIEGRHIGYDEELAELAAEVGLDRSEALAAIQSGQYSEAVQADIDQAHAYGIGGVPFFVLDGRYGLSGAQPAETFLNALERVREESGAAA